MSKRLALVWALFLLTALAASAGDVAQFVNLGFSKDARYFMFAQYGILEKDSLAWADTYIVDVPANTFAPKGMNQFVGAQPVDPSASGLGALLNAFSEALPRVKQLRIDHLSTGRLLYVLLDGALAADQMEFRDFQSGRSYKIALTQIAPTATAGASFSISISVTEKDGATRNLKAGSPNFTRKGVKTYHIKQIILAPDGESLVFIVQKDEQDTAGNNIRYMVETVRPK